MKILLHLCCGPCTAYPLATLRSQGLKTEGFFYNPNIHPYREFEKRLAAVETLSVEMDFPVEYTRSYGLHEYLHRVVFHESDRCSICYTMRLTAAARKARENGADAFTSTLLYSRYQNHEKIRSTAERIAEENNIPFYYQDFRQGWQTGVEKSIEMGLYRQSYCGCIYSEQERYDKALRKK